jgi:hypothetical protein
MTGALANTRHWGKCLASNHKNNNVDGAIGNSVAASGSGSAISEARQQPAQEQFLPLRSSE